LKVEPGGYNSLTARFDIGRSLSLVSRFQAASILPRSWLARSFGSYDGRDTMARIRPVLGSIATTAPFLLPSALYAAFWAAGFSVRPTLAPC
jgi:hypothetical protein